MQVIENQYRIVGNQVFNKYLDKKFWPRYMHKALFYSDTEKIIINGKTYDKFKSPNVSFVLGLIKVNYYGNLGTVLGDPLLSRNILLYWNNYVSLRSKQYTSRYYAKTRALTKCNRHLSCHASRNQQAGHLWGRWRLSSDGTTFSSQRKIMVREYASSLDWPVSLMELYRSYEERKNDHRTAFYAKFQTLIDI